MMGLYLFLCCQAFGVRTQKKNNRAILSLCQSLLSVISIPFASISYSLSLPKRFAQIRRFQRRKRIVPREEEIGVYWTRLDRTQPKLQM